MRKASTILVFVGLAALSASGCRNNSAMAESRVLTSNGQPGWATNCPVVAKNAVIGLIKAERPDMPVDPLCEGRGICVGDGHEASRDGSLITFKVSGEYMSGAFGYDVVIAESGDACRVKSVTYKYAD